MKISLVTSNSDFIQFLETRAVGMTLLNSYSTLTDTEVMKKFSDDFNHVDIFLFLDFQDLSAEFRQFLRYVREGKSYFLNTKEIVVIANKSEELSPTSDLETTLQAATTFMESANIPIRIVRLDSLKFQDIYKSLTSADSLSSSTPQKLIKYKVSHNSAGEVMSPEKRDISVVPDKLKGIGSASKIEDLKSASAWENTQVDVPSVVDGKRTKKVFKDNTSLKIANDSLTIFITGARYSGKTRLGLSIAKEFELENGRTLICDLTSRTDIALVNKDIGCSIGYIKGLSSINVPNNPVLAIHVHRKVYSSIFLNSLIRGLNTTTKVTIVEVDPEEFKDMYNSFVGEKIVLVPIVNTSVSLRDSLEIINSMKVSVYPVINTMIDSSPIDKKVLVNMSANIKEILDINDISVITRDIVG